MTTSNYRILLNTFESGTRKSHTKAVKLSTDTTDKLRTQTDPDLVSIFAAYEPHHESYIALNVAIEMAEGIYKGKTSSFESILDTLPDKLRMWEPPVYTLFPEDSPVALEIFPHKRSPFLQGTYESRLLSVRALRDNLLNYTVANPTLVPIQADVAAFYTLANTARQTQQAREGGLGELRHQRETQRVTTMNAYWGLVFGGLLRKYYNDPDSILGFIDLDDFYDNASDAPELFEGDIEAGKVLNINNLAGEDLNVTPQTKVRMKNTSANSISLTFYTANSPTDNPGAGPQFTLSAGQSLDKTAAELGLETFEYYNIYNATTLPGSWEIQVFV